MRALLLNANWPAPDNLRQAVVYASRISRFMPATRNGQPVEVHAALMVIVDTRLDDDPLILAVPNNGVETARYGLLYTAPQRYGEHIAKRPKVRLHQAAHSRGVDGVADRRARCHPGLEADQ